ncbi:hypothetical protein MIMGU_mgv11b023454mg [Erythranthe guttata]|uniref:AAA+ ATPase domain-containing protein n=1 Tax=Erythranthe guttata TaxID=4155 RepID=A0A022Q2M8_ERYGU|nr:PREDICTED: putative disease resistance protein RGA3 [Erythranthe guttata]EYU21418.1 hypothetical protein MIMGU_mgv11b023454mg [Erythranthe guttata]|eukprot:XP_012856098.1 PREDICTED: putative disease resistance protein RGA3 [Erythranthe guttata]
MAEAIVSIVVERLAGFIAEQIQNEVNLVRGVDKELKSLSRDLNTVRNVLDDAEKKGCKDKIVKDWLKRLEDASYEMDDVLDEWNYSILKFQIEQSSDRDVAAAADAVVHKKKVWSFIPSSCVCFKKVVIRHDIALKIKEVKARLDLILREKDRFGFVTSQPIDPSRESWRVQSTSLIDLEEVCGRELERESMVSELVGEGGNGEELGIRVTSIVGEGGLGKTTLAKLAYNDTRVEKHFELRIWICVSDPFNEVEIAKGIVASVKKLDNPPNTNQLETLLQSLKETISGKKFLLVLDDVWTEDDTKWEPLKNSLTCGGAGSKVLVTTRNQRVAIMMGTVRNEIHNLGHLSDKDCWLLLRRVALSGMDEEECVKFQSVGMSIAKKCKGLPLAAKTLGSLLRFKNTLQEWENVLLSEIWQLEEAEVELFPHLLLSYNELSPSLKRCFSYCAIFPKDSDINVESLISKWVALGYVGSNGGSVGDWKLRGMEYFDKLAMRSLFQDFKVGFFKKPWYFKKGVFGNDIQWFKMHDIVHDFAQFLRKGGEMREEMTNKTTCQTCKPLSVYHVKEYRSLSWSKKSQPRLCDCLTSMRLLDLKGCNLRSIPKEIEKLIHLRWLDLGHNKFPAKDLKTICKLYNLQFLWLNSCELEEIPREIGNLIHLKHLDLQSNGVLKELPESLCDLRELESLDISACYCLSRLPEGIHRLINLKHLDNTLTHSLKQFPQGLGQLTSLSTLRGFYGGRHCSKFGLLKNLNRLSGSLELVIKLSGDDWVVEDAREAELRKKIHLQKLEIMFSISTKDCEEMKEGVWTDIIDVLEPHPNLQNLEICNYYGLRLPGWVVSPLNHLRSIRLSDFEYMSSLPPLGKLPFLESVEIRCMPGLQFLGREFLGITTTKSENNMDSEVSSSSSCGGTNNGGIIQFPKLKELKFSKCSNWKEWEDITAEEEEEEEDGVGVSLIMPCLTKLTIFDCTGLTELPHRLLQKVSPSLKELDIRGSKGLEQVYGDKEGKAWKSISHHNPNLLLKQYF